MSKRTTNKAIAIRAALASDKVFPAAVYKMGDIREAVAQELGIPVKFLGAALDVYMHDEPSWSHNGSMSRDSRWPKNGAPFKTAPKKLELNVGMPHSRLDALAKDVPNLTHLVQDTARCVSELLSQLGVKP